MIIAQKIEAIHYHHDKPKISNPNTQIANNIQIKKSNDPNILATYLLFDGRFACFEFISFDHWDLFGIWYLMLGISMILSNNIVYVTPTSYLFM